MTVGVEDGPRWVAGGQVLGLFLTVNVVVGTTVGDEVRGFVNQRSSPGIGTDVVGVPKGTAEVDFSEIIDH